MADYGSPHERHAPGEASSISVPWVVLTSLVCGFGILLIALWLITLDWIFFPGIALVIIGAIMFLNDRMGLDHA